MEGFFPAFTMWGSSPLVHASQLLHQARSFYEASHISYHPLKLQLLFLGLNHKLRPNATCLRSTSVGLRWQRRVTISRCKGNVYARLRVARDHVLNSLSSRRCSKYLLASRSRQSGVAQPHFPKARPPSARM